MDAVAQAYDSLAADYDRLVGDDAWMRRILWRRYAANLPHGGRVLDLACGRSSATTIALSQQLLRQPSGSCTNVAQSTPPKNRA